MTDASTLEARLRDATEQDVEAALTACSAGADIELASSAELLEFFNRMLDRLLDNG
jgi:hypothetical protein